MTDPAAFFSDLDAALGQAWQLLEQGAIDRRCPAHTPTLASVGLGGEPQLRTVVLRACDRDSQTLLIHSDHRSPKFAELQRDPRCALHLYDPGQKMQLRVQARASLHTDDAIAERDWSAAQRMSRLVYGVRQAPGSVIADPAAAVDGLNQASEAEQRRSFAVIRLQIESLEWLYLAAAGHRRARFRLGRHPQADWLVP